MNFLYDIEEGSENKVREKLKKYIVLFAKCVYNSKSIKYNTLIQINKKIYNKMYYK